MKYSRIKKQASLKPIIIGTIILTIIAIVLGTDIVRAGKINDRLETAILNIKQ